MKIFFEFILLVGSVAMLWKFWPSETEPTPAPKPVKTPTPGFPKPLLPTATPVPRIPAQKRYIRDLEEIFLVLTSDIVPEQNDESFTKRIFKENQLKEAWETGQEMYRQEVLSLEEAQVLVRFIKTSMKIQELRHTFHDRYERAYNKPQSRMGRNEERDYSALNVEWQNKVRRLQQDALGDLSQLGSDLYESTY